MMYKTPCGCIFIALTPMQSIKVETCRSDSYDADSTGLCFIVTNVHLEHPKDNQEKIPLSEDEVVRIEREMMRLIRDGELCRSLGRIIASLSRARENP